jgi:hypothetical protein
VSPLQGGTITIPKPPGVSIDPELPPVDTHVLLLLLVQEKYGISESDFPVYKLFKRGNKGTPVDYKVRRRE